jgi:ABC-2 type transport system permease protein
MWWMVNYLGTPDNGLIIAGYCGSIMLAAAYVAIGACISAASSSQIVAFVLSASVCLLFTLAGSPLVTGLLAPFLPESSLELLSQFGFITYFEDITRGLVTWQSILYFISTTLVWLFINRLLVEREGTL